MSLSEIQSGPYRGSILTADGEIVSRRDPRLSIEHQIALVLHYNSIGYNTSRAVRKNFFNDTSNMTVRLRGPNSSDGAKMNNLGIRYRQDVGPNYSR